MFSGYLCDFIATKNGMAKNEPINIDTTHNVGWSAPNINPVIAGPATPEILHCNDIKALARPRICSGASSLAKVGITGACTISPTAKINWLMQSAIPEAINGKSGDMPTKSQELDQMIPIEISALYFE